MQKPKLSKKLLASKKAQMAGSVGIIITLIVGISVAVLVLIFIGTLSGQTYELVEDDITEIGTRYVYQEAFTALNSTWVQLAHYQIRDVVIQNQSLSSGQIATGNFTIDGAGGKVYLKPTVPYPLLNNSVMYINYTYGNVNVSRSVKQSILSSFDALEQTGNYLPIIVLAVIIMIVMALILGSIGNMGMMRGGGGAL